MSRFKANTRVRFKHGGMLREGLYIKSCQFDPYSSWVAIDGVPGPQGGQVLVSNAALTVVSQPEPQAAGCRG